MPSIQKSTCCIFCVLHIEVTFFKSSWSRFPHPANVSAVRAHCPCRFASCTSTTLPQAAHQTPQNPKQPFQTSRSETQPRRANGQSVLAVRPSNRGAVSRKFRHMTEGIFSLAQKLFKVVRHRIYFSPQSRQSFLRCKESPHRFSRDHLIG